MRRKALAAASGILMAISALSGCSNGTHDASPNVASSPAPTTAPPGDSATAGAAGGSETGTSPACPADTPINIGMVTTGQNNVQIDNPWLPTSTGQLLAYNRLRLEPLAVVNRLNPAEITPWLASDFSWNDDYSQITITARDGVNWSDGTPFTADDIAKTFEVMRDTEVAGARTLDPQGLIGEITVNGNQVTINFTRPRVTDWAVVLHQSIMQKAYLDTISDIMTDPMVGFPATGPYEVTSFTPGSVRLDRRDDYWGGNGQHHGLPAAQTINFVSYNDNNAVETALQAGTLTWSQSPLTNPSAFVSANPNYHIWWTPSDLIIEQMHLNVNRPPFDDPVFRKVANMVINREAWREITLQGEGELLTSATGLILPAGEAFLDPTLADATLSLDVEGAHQLLRDAGYLNVGVPGGLQYPDGTPVTLTLSAPSDWNDYVSSASMITQSLRNDLGADATFVAADVDSWWESTSLGDFDAAQRTTGNNGIGPFWVYRNMIAQRGMGGVAELGEAADWNLGRYFNPAVQNAFEILQTSPDEAAREQALFTIQRAVVEDSPVLLLGGRPIFSAFNTQCFTNWPTNDNPYTAAQLINPGAALMVVTSLEPR
jgi:peptide/nickel transport system substrate-binding protein